VILDLVGVYQDGSAQSSDVPFNPRQALALTQGATVLLRLHVVTTSGVPVDILGGGWSLVWSAKKVRNGCSFKRQGAAILSAGAGRVDFLLTAAETAALKTGKYGYDVFMIGPGGVQEPVVPFSELVVEPSKYLEVEGPITPSPSLPIIVPSAERVYLPGFSTAGVSAGRMVYASGNYSVSHTDAAALPGAHALGHYDGTSGKVLAFGIANAAAFVASSPAPTVNSLVFLARGDEEADAPGKLTASAPSQGFVAPVGSVVSVPTDYASSRVAEVLVRVVSFVRKAS